MRTKNKYKVLISFFAILLSVVTIGVGILVSAPKASAGGAIFVDGDGNSYNGTGTNVNGAFNIISTDTDTAIAGYRFTVLTYNDATKSYKSDGSLDVFKDAKVHWGVSNKEHRLPSYSYNNYDAHLKYTFGNVTMYGLDKYSLNSYYSSSLTIEVEDYDSSNSKRVYSSGTIDSGKYNFALDSDLGVRLPTATNAKTFAGDSNKMDLILQRINGQYTLDTLLPNPKQFVFMEPIFSLRLGNTVSDSEDEGFSITLTEIALIGRLTLGNNSDGTNGSGYGKGWTTIRRFTNSVWPSSLYTSDKSSHSELGIDNGTKLYVNDNSYELATFEEIFEAGYGLHITWNRNLYYIDYDLDGGHFKTAQDTINTVGTGSTKYVYNPSFAYYNIKTPGADELWFYVENPEKDGYTFDGWHITKMSNDCTHWYFKQNPGESTTNEELNLTGKPGYKYFKNLRITGTTSDTTVLFTAKWKRNSSTLYVNPNGGTWNGSTGIQQFTQYQGTTKSIPVPSRSGYTFAGWTKSTPFYGSMTSLVAQATYTFSNYNNVSDTITANWNENKYNIVYSLGEGGTFKTAKDTLVTYSNGQTKMTNPTYAFYGKAFDDAVDADGNTVYYFLVENPTRPGYIFKGWYITGMDTSHQHVYWLNKSGPWTSTGGRKTTSVAVFNCEGSGDTNQHFVANDHGESYVTNFYNLNGSKGTVTFTARWVAAPTLKIQYCSWLNIGNVQLDSSKYKFVKDIKNSDGSIDERRGYICYESDGSRVTTKLVANTRNRTELEALAKKAVASKGLINMATFGLSCPYYTIKSGTYGHLWGGTVDWDGIPENNKNAYAKSFGESYNSLTWEQVMPKARLESFYNGGTGTINLYVQWDGPITNTLTINPNGGEAYANGETFTTSKTYTKYAGQIESGIKRPTRIGYTFAGWTKSTPFYGSVKPTNISISLKPLVIDKVYTYNHPYEKNTNDILTARWTPNVSTLIVDPNGGSWYNPDTNVTSVDEQSIVRSYDQGVNGNPPIVHIALPTRDGYEFKGWDLKKDQAGLNAGFDPLTPNGYFSTDDIYSGTTSLMAEGDYYYGKYDSAVDRATAYWLLKNYTAVFRTNNGTWSDGTTEEKSVTYTIEDILEAPDFVSRVGYTFKGWRIIVGRGNWEATTYNNDPQTMLEGAPGKYGDIYFYAQWEATPYTATFVTNNGTWSDNTTSNKKVTYTIEDVLEAPDTVSKPGCAFDGWYVMNTYGNWTPKTYNNDPQTTLENKTGMYGNVFFYAQWKANPSYTITYKWRDNDAVIGYGRYTSGLETPLIDIPYCFGHTVTNANTNNWFTGKTGTDTTNKILASDTGDKTFYAERFPNQYNIKYYWFEFDGDYDESKQITGLEPSSYLYGDMKQLAVIPECPGYNVPNQGTNDWCIWPDTVIYETISSTKTQHSDLSVYAYRQLVNYTATFIPDGGSWSDGATTTKTKTYTINDILTAPATISKTGYTFAGWKVTVQDGNWDNDTYNNDPQTKLYGDSGKYGNVTFTALWTSNTFNITYKWRDDDSVISTDTYNAGTAKDLMIVPTVDYYTVTNSGTHTWFTGKTGTDTATQILTTDTGDKVFYADKVLTVYNATFKPNGGRWEADSSTSSKVLTYTFGTAINILDTDTVSRSNYRFLGWKVTASTGNWAVDNTLYTNAQIRSHTDKYGDVTFTAQWEQIYNAEFRPNGGTWNDGTTENKNAIYSATISIDVPGTVSQDYHYFKGWKVLSSVGTWTKDTVYTATEIEALTGMSGNVVFVAQWTPYTYTVRFHENGGTGTMADQKFNYGVAQNLSNLTFEPATGYHLASTYVWNTVPGGSGTKYTNKQSVKNLTNVDGGYVDLYAQWEINSSTLRIDPNGGVWEGSTAIQTIKANYKTQKTITVPTRNGYVFTGWTKSSPFYGTISSLTETATYTYGAENNVTSTLTANWEKVQDTQYTATFVPNGGKWTSGSAVSSNRKVYYTVNTSITVPGEVAKDGYDFTGWKVTSTDGTWVQGQVYTTDEIQNAKNMTGNVTFTAQWKVTTYKAIFETGGGTWTGGNTANRTRTYTISTTLTAPTTVTRNGYVFAGWKVTLAEGNWVLATVYNNDPQTKLHGSSGKYGNVTFTAQWEADRYTATFDPNGGIWNDGTTENKSLGYTLGENIIAPGTVSKTGYKFASTWKVTESDGTTDEFWPVGQTYSTAQIKAETTKKGNVTFTAILNPIQYTVKYDRNGGSGSMSNQTFTYDEEKALNKNTFTRTGYTFQGWNTKADGSGDSYTDQQVVKNLTTVSGGSVTMYAQWKPITYKVRLKPNGGSGTAIPDQIFTYDVEQALTENTYTRTGYTFNGWNTATDGSGTPYADKQVVKNLSSVQDDVIILQAQWTPNVYSITYHWVVNGVDIGVIDGVTPTSYTYDIEQNLGIVPDYGRGYGTYYKGTTTWYTSVNGNNTVSKTTATDIGDKVFYAHVGSLTYEIFCDMNGGTLSDDYFYGGKFFVERYDVAYYPSVFSSDTAITKLTAVPTRVGYIFTGYNTKADGSGQKVIDADGNILTSTTFYPTANAYWDPNESTYADTIYAQWEPMTYIIHFDPNGGSGTMEDQIVTYDDFTQTLNPNTFIPPVGYDDVGFDCWTLTPELSGKEFYDGDAITENLVSVPNSEITLYAQWWPNTYYVAFKGNGATGTTSQPNGGTMTNQTFTYDRAQNLKANEYVRKFNVTCVYQDGTTSDVVIPAISTFKGWSTTSNGLVEYSDKQSVINLTATANAVVDLYAKWTDETIVLPNPTKPGYEFDGWYPTNDPNPDPEDKIGNGGDPYTPDEDITIYGHWTPIEYDVKFHPNGGTPAGNTTQHFVYNQGQNLTQNPYTRPGYKFDGWNTQPDGSGTPYTDTQYVINLTTTKNDVIDLYAQWKPIEYIIRFDPNGGEGTMADLPMIYDVEKNLTELAFDRPGYQPQTPVWNTKPDGSGVSYADMQAVKNLTLVDGDVITLYAQWKNDKPLVLVAVAQNADYTEGTEVVTSYHLINETGRDRIPTDNVTLTFRIYNGEELVDTVVINNAIVPDNEQNLYYFKWTVPTGIDTNKIRIVSNITENGTTYGERTAEFNTRAFTASVTPDIEYTFESPAWFNAIPAVPEGSCAETASWTVWTYSDGAFSQVTYGLTLNANYVVTPDENANTWNSNGIAYTRSAYGLNFTFSGDVSALDGTVTATEDMYTTVQGANAYVPEFLYSDEFAKYRTLELVDGELILCEDEYGDRSHFIPLWYPDSKQDNGTYKYYVVFGQLTDFWTPAGMLHASGAANPIGIEGTVYDDWQLG